MDERKQQLIVLVGQVLEHLKPWYIDHSHDYYNVRAIRDDMPEAALWFNLDRERLEISGGYPRKYEPYASENPPRISVSAGRPAESIAKDIKRRFLPEYIPLYAQKVKLKRETEAQIAVTNAALDELAALLGGQAKYAEQGRPGNVYFSRGKLEAYPHDPPDFHLDVRELSLEVTRKVCALLAS